VKNMGLSRKEAVEYGKRLLDDGWLHNVNLTRHKFKDKPTLYQWTERKLPVVVVLGGGFAGSNIAKQLDKDPRLDVLLIDDKSYFEQTQGSLRILSEPSIDGSLKAAEQITVPHERYLKHGRFIKEAVKEVTPHRVVLHNRTIVYDYLVVATGNRFRSTISAKDVVDNYSVKELNVVAVDIQSGNHILIIGGDVTGVELASELILAYPSKQITLVHDGKRLLESASKKAHLAALKWLQDQGVNVILEETVLQKKEDIQTKRFWLQKSNKILEVDKVLWSGRKVPNTQYLEKNFADSLDENKAVKVNGYFQVSGYENIFAAGGVTNISEEKIPMNALLHAELIPEHIKLLVRGKQPKRAYSPRSKTQCRIISLGANCGILVANGKYIMSGSVPAMMRKGFINCTIKRLKKKTPSNREIKKSQERAAGQRRSSFTSRSTLVIGVESQLGVEVADAMLDQGVPVRIAVPPSYGRNLTKWKQRGAQILEFDFSKPQTLQTLFKGIEVVFLTGDVGPIMVEQGKLIVEAMSRFLSTIKHIVKCHFGAVNAEKANNAIAKWNLTVEKMITDLNIPYTFVRYSNVFNNLAKCNVMKYQRTLMFPGQNDVKVAWMDMDDVIKSIVAILFHTERHQNVIHTLTGPEKLYGKDLAKILSRSIREEITFVPIGKKNLGSFTANITKRGCQLPVVNAFVDMFSKQESHLLRIVNNTVEELTGDKPKSFQWWAHHNAHYFV